MTFHNAHLSAHGFIGYGTHSAIIPPAIPPVLLPHISASTLLGLTIKAKYSKKEFGPGFFPLMARGNDSGLIVSHVSIPPTNVLLAVIIPLGSSKVMFGSSKVHINVDGKAEHCGCCLPPIIPFSQNMACNDPCSYPSDYVIAPNTIEVSMTLGDLIMGLISAAFDVAVSFFVGKAAGGVGNRVVNRVARAEAGRAFQSLSSTFGSDAAESMVKDIAENIAESYGAQIGSGFVNELIKTGMGEGLDLSVKLISSGHVENTGDLLDKSAQGYAAIAGQGPASDPRIYSTDGDGVRVSEW